MDMNLVDIQHVPIWVQLRGLPLKFWGTNCLRKLVGLIGVPKYADAATIARYRVGYVRFLVEMDVDGKFPEIIEFLDEKGNLIRQPVHYEWRPMRCSECNDLGHEGASCPEKETYEEEERCVKGGRCSG